jgi:hypothetical protein
MTCPVAWPVALRRAARLPWSEAAGAQTLVATHDGRPGGHP